MLRRSLGLLVMSGVLVAGTGCGGGDSGPRGATTGGAPGAGGMGTDVPVTHGSLRTVAYLPTYHGSLSNWQRTFPFQNASYVNLSFADVDASGTVKFPDLALGGFVEAAHAKGTKVCVALGGATTINDGGPFATVLTDANRPTFIANLLKFADGYKLDCLDIDLEGRGVNAFYEAFVTELSAGLKAQGGKELTAAVASWFGDGISDKALATFDFINVMAYDLYSDLSTPMQTSSIEAANRAVDDWVNRGVPREKVVYGVPFYGIQWPLAGGKQGAQITYNELIHRDPNAATMDVLQTADTITYLNSRATIQAKAQLAKTYGGIMVWEAGQDATGEASLLQAIRDAVP